MFLCETCAYFTPSEPVLNEHIRLLHSQAMESKFKFGVEHAVEKVLAGLAVIYKCAICDFSSHLESDLTLHVKRSVMCNKCTYHTEDMRDLREHVVTAHGEVDPLDVCEAVMSPSTSEASRGVTPPALSPTMEFGTVTTGEKKEGHPEDAAAERGAAQPDGGPLHGDRDAQGEPHQRPPHDRHRRTDQPALLGLRHHQGMQIQLR